MTPFTLISRSYKVTALAVAGVLASTAVASASEPPPPPPPPPSTGTEAPPVPPSDGTGSAPAEPAPAPAPVQPALPAATPAAIGAATGRLRGRRVRVALNCRASGRLRLVRGGRRWASRRFGCSDSHARVAFRLSAKRAARIRRAGRMDFVLRYKGRAGSATAPLVVTAG